jgi:hypothetical protein
VLQALLAHKGLLALEVFKDQQDRKEYRDAQVHKELLVLKELSVLRARKVCKDAQELKEVLVHKDHLVPLVLQEHKVRSVLRVYRVK